MQKHQPKHDQKQVSFFFFCQTINLDFIYVKVTSYLKTIVLCM